MATPCRCPPESSPTFTRTEGMSIRKVLMMCSASAYNFLKSIQKPKRVGSMCK